MELNDYSDVINNISNLNSSIVNADNFKQEMKEKIPDMIGDILIADGSRELLGKVLTPLAKSALEKIGIGSEDIEDLSNGRITKVALRKIQQKLGINDKVEELQNQAQRQADRVLEPNQVQEPDKILEGAEEQPVENATTAGKTLNDALDDPQLFKNFALESFPQYANESDEFFEDARNQVREMSNLDLEQPLGNFADRLAPGYRVLADVTRQEQPPSNNLVNPDDDLKLEDGTSYEMRADDIPLQNLNRNIVNRSVQNIGQQITTDDNTMGASEDLLDQFGSNIRQLANQSIGISDSDAAISNFAKSTISGIGEDVGLDTAEAGLETAAASTAEIPVVGEVLAPLLAIGGGLAALFGHKKEAPPPFLNPSFQFD